MPKISYNLYAKSKNYNMNSASVEGVVEQTRLSNTYFSKCNIEILQKIIAYDIYKKIGKKIGKQSEHDLLIIMRSYFLQNANNVLVKDEDIRNEIRKLNIMVKDDAVKRIISMIKQHDAYIKDINNMSDPINRAESTNIKGRKLAEMNRFI